MHAAKKALRKELKKRLLALSEEEKERQSNHIAKALFVHPKYIESRSISVFLSMHDEVKTLPILEHALNNQKSVFIPKYVGDNMDMVKIDSMEDYHSLPETKWHIKQPADDDKSRPNALDAGGLDLILMPGLGFTQDGRRIGRGKGYYDSYISKCEKQNHRTFLLALAYSVQICDDLPSDAHDKKVDDIISVED